MKLFIKWQRKNKTPNKQTWCLIWQIEFDQLAEQTRIAHTDWTLIWISNLLSLWMCDLWNVKMFVDLHIQMFPFFFTFVCLFKRNKSTNMIIFIVILEYKTTTHLRFFCATDSNEAIHYRKNSFVQEHICLSETKAKSRRYTLIVLKLHVKRFVLDWKD